MPLDNEAIPPLGVSIRAATASPWQTNLRKAFAA
jgi:hypothetical protein